MDADQDETPMEQVDTLSDGSETEMEVEEPFLEEEPEEVEQEVIEQIAVDKLLAWRFSDDKVEKHALPGTPVTGRHVPNFSTARDPLSPENPVEFMVLFKNQSYLHVKWLDRDYLIAHGGKLMRSKVSKYIKKNPSPCVDEGEIFSPYFCEVDRILACRAGEDDRLEYLVKWQCLPYSSSTWEYPEDFKDDSAIASFEYFSRAPTNLTTKPKRPRPSAWEKFEESPAYKNDNKLRPWQIEGVSWLLFNWYNRKGCILADEMGLGKTVQSVATVDHIGEAYCRGPFIIIVPLSTVPHWKREFEAWTELNTVVYQGSRLDREMIRLYEWHYWDRAGRETLKEHYKFNVLIVTYESLMADVSFLTKIKWRACIIDEAHRLKNKKSKLFKCLSLFDFEHRVLLTGTPIQNNIEELWTLLNFIQPTEFSSVDEFSAQFGDLKTTDQVDKLHEALRPYLLRRMKEDVAKKIPPKEETLIEVELTLLQKQYYRAVLERNRSFLYKGCKGSNVPKLLNVVMQLRKVCNHPFLIAGVEEKETEGCVTREEFASALIGTSGKLVLVDKLLPKLKAGGHKVLIFSQMKMVLDLLEYYMQLKDYKYERIDGSIRGNERQEAIDRFNRPDSDRFVFMLSTRAGGLGINLATADTVIIYDSDWNPQNDMQAQARCHRIGQTKAVTVYRLITARTYEKEMFRRASMKLGLDQAVLTNMRDTGSSSTKLDKKEIDQLLKYGAYDLFNENADKQSESFCEEDIDQILAKRSQTFKTGGDVKHEPSTFSTASFSANTEDDSAPRVDDEDFWEKMLPDEKSPEKLLTRLRNGEAAKTEEDAEQFIEDLSEHVEMVVELRQQGIAPANVDLILGLLRELCDMDDDKFPKQLRTKARSFIDMIEHPRRYRRAVDLWGSSYSEGHIDLKESVVESGNGLGSAVLSRKQRRMLAVELIQICGASRKSVPPKFVKVVVNGPGNDPSKKHAIIGDVAGPDELILDRRARLGAPLKDLLPDPIVFSPPTKPMAKRGRPKGSLNKRGQGSRSSSGDKRSNKESSDGGAKTKSADLNSQTTDKTSTDNTGSQSDTGKQKALANADSASSSNEAKSETADDQNPGDTEKRSSKAESGADPSKKADSKDSSKDDSKNDDGPAPVKKRRRRRDAAEFSIPLPFVEPIIDHTNIWIDLRNKCRLQIRPLVHVVAWGLSFIGLCIDACSDPKDKELFQETRDLLIKAIPYDVGLIEEEEKAIALKKAAALEAEREQERLAKLDRDRIRAAKREADRIRRREKRRAEREAREEAKTIKRRKLENGKEEAIDNDNVDKREEAETNDKDKKESRTSIPSDSIGTNVQKLSPETLQLTTMAIDAAFEQYTSSNPEAFKDSLSLVTYKALLGAHFVQLACDNGTMPATLPSLDELKAMNLNVDSLTTVLQVKQEESTSAAAAASSSSSLSSSSTSPATTSVSSTEATTHPKAEQPAEVSTVETSSEPIAHVKMEVSDNTHSSRPKRSTKKPTKEVPTSESKKPKSRAKTKVKVPKLPVVLISPAISFDVAKATTQLFPSLQDKGFVAYIEKRTRRWARQIRLTQQIKYELDRHILDWIRYECKAIEDAKISSSLASGANKKGKGRRKKKVEEKKKGKNNVESKYSPAADLLYDPDLVQGTTASRSPPDFPIDLFKTLPAPNHRKEKLPVWWWTPEDDQNLCIGVVKHGLSLDSHIRNDPQLGFRQKLGFAATDRKFDDQWAHLDQQPEAQVEESTASSSSSTTSSTSESSTSNSESSSQSMSIVIPTSASKGCLCSDENQGNYGSFMTCRTCSKWYHIPCLSTTGPSANASPGPFTPVDTGASTPLTPMTPVTSGFGLDGGNAPSSSRSTSTDGTVSSTVSSVQFDPSGQWCCSSCDIQWPASRVLEFRLRTLLDFLQKSRRARTREREKVDRNRARELAKQMRLEEHNAQWTKREKHDLERLMVMEVVHDKNLESVQVKAGLNRKTISSIKTFKQKLLKQCRYMMDSQARKLQAERIAQARKVKDAEKKVYDQAQKRIDELVALNQDTSLYCTCQSVSGGRFMVGCDAAMEGCFEWYHGECVGIADESQVPEQWFCEHCTKKNEGESAAKEAESAKDAKEVEKRTSQRTSRRKRKFRGMSIKWQPVQKPNRPRCDNPMTDEHREFSTCQYILEELQRMPEAAPFNTAVDPEYLGIPDYFKHVTHPMDFENIRKNLMRGAYDGAESFVEDIQLVFSNCEFYNKMSSPIYMMMKECKRAMHQLVALVMPTVREAQGKSKYPARPKPSTPSVQTVQTNSKIETAPVVEAMDQSSTQADVKFENVDKKSSQSVDSMDIDSQEKAASFDDGIPNQVSKLPQADNSDAMKVDGQEQKIDRREGANVNVKQEPDQADTVPVATEEGKEGKMDQVPTLTLILLEAASEEEDQKEELSLARLPKLRRPEIMDDTLNLRGAEKIVWRHRLLQQIWTCCNNYTDKELKESWKEVEIPQMPDWWTSTQDIALLRGVCKYSIGAVQEMLNDPELKDKWQWKPTKRTSKKKTKTSSTMTSSASSTKDHDTKEVKLKTEEVDEKIEEEEIEESSSTSSPSEEPSTKSSLSAPAASISSPPKASSKRIAKKAASRGAKHSQSDINADIDTPENRIVFLTTYLRDRLPVVMRMKNLCCHTLFQSDFDPEEDLSWTLNKSYLTIIEGSAQDAKRQGHQKGVLQSQASSSKKRSRSTKGSSGSSSTKNSNPKKRRTSAKSNSSKKKKTPKLKRKVKQPKEEKAPKVPDEETEKKKKLRKSRAKTKAKDNRIRKFEDVPRHPPVPGQALGAPILPITTKKNCTILELGTIVHNRPLFHRWNAIYPVGFTSVRQYPSYLDPEKSICYICKVIDGKTSGPQFLVTAEDDPANPILASSASYAWGEIVCRINEARPAEKRRSSKCHISGPEMFGLSDPVVKKLIEELPGAKLCSGYRIFNSKSGAKDKKESDDSPNEQSESRPVTSVEVSPTASASPIATPTSLPMSTDPQFLGPTSPMSMGTLPSMTMPLSNNDAGTSLPAATLPGTSTFVASPMQVLTKAANASLPTTISSTIPLNVNTTTSFATGTALSAPANRTFASSVSFSTNPTFDLSPTNVTALINPTGLVTSSNYFPNSGMIQSIDSNGNLAGVPVSTLQPMYSSSTMPITTMTGVNLTTGISGLAPLPMNMTLPAAPLTTSMTGSTPTTSTSTMMTGTNPMAGLAPTSTSTVMTGLAPTSTTMLTATSTYPGSQTKPALSAAVMTPNAGTLANLSPTTLTATSSIPMSMPVVFSSGSPATSPVSTSVAPSTTIAPSSVPLTSIVSTAVPVTSTSTAAPIISPATSPSTSVSVTTSQPPPASSSS